MTRPSLAAGPPVRLLPMTIAAVAAMLAVKSVSLVRASVQPGPGGPAATLASAGQAVVASAKAAPPGPEGPGPAPASMPTPMPAAGADPGSAPIKSAPPPEIGDSERGVLLDLRHERDELDRKEQTVAARESMLGVAEARLSARVTELQTLQAQLEGLESARRERDEAGWRGLVKLYETMKPRDAAAIMNDLDGEVLVQVLDRMKETKAAPVLAAMDPVRARVATAKLAELRTRSSALTAGR